ncbi:MAG TPA: prolyl oligopeptidase family serine peptidase, partial [Thermoanaerobaculia bacterium]
NGGWMAAYAATHSTSFAAAIAGAPVTDWLSYDSILIERFMGHPKNNAEGYRKSSPRWNAKDLSARLLLQHGTIDDNVHLQNTFQFAQELQKEGKLFEMMLYPQTRHTVFNPTTNLHIAKTTVDFLRRTFGEGAVGR